MRELLAAFLPTEVPRDPGGRVEAAGADFQPGEAGLRLPETRLAAGPAAVGEEGEAGPADSAEADTEGAG